MSVRASWAAAAAALVLSGCATTTSRPGFCNAQPGQLFVGQRADAATGLAIRRATGSDLVRWAPPHSALTMDFQEGRVTVAYDDTMSITSVRCG